MSGLKLEIPFAVTDTTIPILRDDPMLSNGSLVLMDLTAGGYTVPASIPAGVTDSLIANVAWKEASAILGAGTATSLAFQTLNNLSGTNGKAEITAKKGIHAIMSQVNHTLTTQAFSIRLAQAIRDYLFDNMAHKFFISVWRKKTRVAASDVNFATLALIFGTTGNYLAYEQPIGTTISQNGNASTRRSSAANDLNTYIRNSMSSGGPNGTPSASFKNHEGNSLMALGGQINAFPGSSVLNKMPSLITYRVYIEDVTVSQRSYAELDALDMELYTAAFAPGGKFFGDTFTDPATLP